MSGKRNGRYVRSLVLAIFYIVFGFELGVMDKRARQSSIAVEIRSTNSSSEQTTPHGYNGSSSDCPSMMKGQGVPTFKKREELGRILQSEEGFTIGIELGVQKGLYSKLILSDWNHCSQYHLVDLWGHQENYIDAANVNQEEQEFFYNEAIDNTKQWKEKIHVCRNYTTNCALTFDDEFFDFIYVDARHDFKGVFDDLVSYWPKLKVGGIMAGHDYVTNDFVKRTGQDWSKNYDGTIDTTGTVVKGAVDVFAATVCRQVTVAYEDSKFPTWAMRK